MAEHNKLSLKDLAEKVKGLGDPSRGPLVQERVIGEGHVAAMFRLGLKELRNAVTPSRESVADTEIGLYGTLTQGEIAQARGGPGGGPEEESKKSLEDYRKHAEERAKDAEKRMDKGNDRGMEM